jgi:tetratricopeptide (TPR) repeat protein
MVAPDHPTHSIIDANTNASPGFPSTGPNPATQRYLLGDEIARGGMGIIHRATDTVLGREVAVKVLLEKYTPESWAAVRFAGEARITGQLQHPSIPPVHDLGTLPDGRPFLAMKLIKGRTLDENLKAGPDPASDRGRFVAVFEQVCQALAYAHSHDVIHRDLKPANVMVGAFGEVQVMDWGLAKVLGAEPPGSPAETVNDATRAWTQISPSPDSASYTQAGSLIGTPAFIPPEQAMGEIAKVDARADVFGLGAILAVILTGQPPYVGENAESLRVLAARGKLEDCFARLDGSGAEPDLIALCKRCLAFEPADRPADAGEVAKSVAALRAAADERARRAELERVRVEGERATAEAQAAERRKRRRLGLMAAAVLAVAAVGGLVKVLAVQRRANAELAAKNAALADEQAKVQARFETAVKAIETFHTGVSQDMLLKNEQFKELRTNLLNEAARFYEDLDKLLAGQTDTKSRKTLAAGYFQLGELTQKIGDMKEALAVHQKALALRRELAATPGADMETRLDVARSLHAVGSLLLGTGDPAAALAAFQEERDLAAALEAESPTDDVRVLLAYGHNGIGFVLDVMVKPAEALDAFRKALAIYQQLPEAEQYPQPGFGPTFGVQLQAGVLTSIGKSLADLGKPAEGLESFRKASDIMQKLADAYPANQLVQSYLSSCHIGTGNTLMATARPEEAIAVYRKALEVQRKLADAHPAVSMYQGLMAYSQYNLGVALSRTGPPAEALAAFQTGQAIFQKLAEANPGVPGFQSDLAWGTIQIGRQYARAKRFTEAFAAFERGLPIVQKLANANPTIPNYALVLGMGHAYRGWAHIRAGHPAEAAADLRRALALWKKELVTDGDGHFDRSRALALLAGLATDSKSGVTSVEAATFADQSVAALREAVNAGWNWPGDLKEPDFDAVRGRADFQKLVAEVEAKAEKN